MSESRHAKAERMLADGHPVVDVAEAVGVSERTVYRWKAEGKVDPGNRQAAGNGSGGPDTPDTRPRTNGGPPRDGETLADARARKQRALATKHELDAAERVGDLVTVGHLRHAILVVRRAIEAAPGVVRRDVAELLDVEPREAEPLLEEIARRMLEQIRGELEKWVEEERPDAATD